MSITIKKYIKPSLEVIGRLCDKPLSKDLNKNELTKFLNCHSTNLLTISRQGGSNVPYTPR